MIHTLDAAANVSPARHALRHASASDRPMFSEVRQARREHRLAVTATVLAIAAVLVTLAATTLLGVVA